MDNYNQENSNFFDMWAIFTGIIQILTYQMELKSTSNDDLMKELRKQDSVLFGDLHQKSEIIIEQNKQIIKMLNKVIDNKDE